MSKDFYFALGQKHTWPNVPGIYPSQLTFANVMLLQQQCTIASRSHVDISVQFGPYKLGAPIITAPMDTVSGEEMIRKIYEIGGGIGTLPRGNVKDNLEICERLNKDDVPCVYTIGLKDSFKDAKSFKERGAKVVLLDIANGALDSVVKAATNIKEKLGLTIITGNITTYEVAMIYKKAGIDIARVGVGAGGVCTTRRVAGTGFPQLSAVLECSSADIPVIADGGIREPGDVHKAIAAGAFMVMIGSMFAGTEETPGEVVDGKKKIRGQASADYMKDHGVDVTRHRAAEGMVSYVDAKGTVKYLIDEITGGLCSALTYSGAQNLDEFREKSVFVMAPAAAQEEGGRMGKKS